MNRVGITFALLVLVTMVFVGVQFGRGRQEPKSFITKVTTSEQLVDRFSLNDSCAMLLNHVYFPPSTLVEFFCDSKAKQVNVYGKLTNGTIRRAVVPAVFAQPESTSRYVRQYVTQMRHHLTAEHRPYFWLVDGGIYYGAEMGFILEYVPVICDVFDRLWTPPFIVTKEDSATARELNLPPQVLISSADSAKAQCSSSAIDVPLWW